MILPTSLDEWTYKTVLEVVRTYEFEPASFDYKEVLSATNKEHRNEHNNSICRTTCAMANTDGGFILFGVKDRRQVVVNPTERIVGIPLDSDLRKEFGDKLAPLQPNVHFETSPRPIQLPDDATRGIFIVRIPQSTRRPHMLGGKYYRRDAGGSAVMMDHSHVRDLMLLTEERLRNLPLLRSEIALFRIVLDANLGHFGRRLPHYAYGRFSTDALRALLGNTFSLPIGSTLLDDLLKLINLSQYFNGYMDTLAALPWYHRFMLPLHSTVWRTPYQTILAELDFVCTRCEEELARVAERFVE